MSDVLETLEAENGGLVADACKKTVKTMLRNAVENVENQILQVKTEEVFGRFSVLALIFEIISVPLPKIYTYV